MIYLAKKIERIVPRVVLTPELVVEPKLRQYDVPVASTNTLRVEQVKFLREQYTWAPTYAESSSILSEMSKLMEEDRQDALQKQVTKHDEPPPGHASMKHTISKLY